jgi:predicted Zn-ribbon and HTH transcriptional regulator
MAKARRPKEPHEPVERPETLRREIVGLLREQTLSARDISQLVGIPEREVYEHLRHIRRSMGGRGKALTVVPARCRQCGFVFSQREKLTKPGRCPACRRQSIEEPLFSLPSRTG